jgi:hypothetical protein
MYTRQLMQMLG